MQKLGTNYGGWYIPNDIKLDENSIVYTAGVGEDISFDLLLSNKYNSNIILIDPTKRAIEHYKEILRYFKTKEWNFNKITYIEKGLWKEQSKMKFFQQTNPKYVSQSLKKEMFGNDFYEVDVDSIKNLMIHNKHDKIDLLKIDIEGAEIEVINQMLDDKIYPRYLCIEFDLFLKQKDPKNKTVKLIHRLQLEGYKILFNDNMNITFQYLK